MGAMDDACAENLTDANTMRIRRASGEGIRCYIHKAAPGALIGADEWAADQKLRGAGADYVIEKVEPGDPQAIAEVWSGSV